MIKKKWMNKIKNQKHLINLIIQDVEQLVIK